MDRRDPGFDIWIVVADMFIGFLCILFLFLLIHIQFEDDPLAAKATQQEAEVSRLQSIVEQLNKQRDKKDKETRRLEAEIARLQSLVAQIPVHGQQTAAEEENQSPRDRIALLEKENQLLKKGRGKDYCLKGNNTLVEVSAKNGTVEVMVLLQDHDLMELPHKPNLQLQKGQVLKDAREIGRFCEIMWEYEQNADCRFDFRLKFLTDTDYRVTREQFERYFYLAPPVKRIAQ